MFKDCIVCLGLFMNSSKLTICHYILNWHKCFYVHFFAEMPTWCCAACVELCDHWCMAVIFVSLLWLAILSLDKIIGWIMEWGKHSKYPSRVDMIKWSGTLSIDHCGWNLGLYLSTSLRCLVEEWRFLSWLLSNSHLRVFICRVCLLSVY